MNTNRPLQATIPLTLTLALTLGGCLTAPAQAATVFFNADTPAAGTGSGSVETALPLSQLQAVPLPRGRFWIHGDSAEISVIPEWQFDRQPVLSGPVLDTHLAENGAGTTISGVIFFNRGDWLKYFDNPQAIETVVTATQSVSGRIADISQGNIVLTTLSGQSIVLPLSGVSSVRSPRAFSFSLAAGLLSPGQNGDPPFTQAQSVALAPTGTPFHLAALRTEMRRQADSGDISTGKLVALGSFLSLVELAQLAPYLAVPLASSKLQHQMFVREFVANVKSNTFIGQ